MILERVPKILSDESQKINVSLESGKTIHDPKVHKPKPDILILIYAMALFLV